MQTVKQTKEYKGKEGFEVIKTQYFDIQRKIVANMTTESWMEVPHVSCIYEPDATNLLKEFKKLNESGKHPNKITVNTLFLKIIVEGIKAAPAVNGHIVFNRKYVKGKIETYKDINISMPWMLEDGSMMTINLHNFEDKSLDEMTDYISNIARRIKNTDMREAMYEVSLDNTLTALSKGKLLTALRRLIGAKIGHSKVKLLSGDAKKTYNKIPKADRLTKEDIEQGTVTVSNLGSIYRGSYAACGLIDIVPPQIFAIGVNGAAKKPAVFTNEKGEQEIGIRDVVPLTLVFDHRALDFGDLTPFMAKLDEIFDNPEIIHEW